MFHNGRWFKLFCYAKGKQIEPKELESAIESILNDTSEPSKGEAHLAALTAGDRLPWAEVSACSQPSMDCSFVLSLNSSL